MEEESGNHQLPHADDETLVLLRIVFRPVKSSSHAKLYYATCCVYNRGWAVGNQVMRTRVNDQSQQVTQDSSRRQQMAGI